LGIIHKIIASIFQGNALTDMQDDHLLLGTRQKITPYGYKLLLIGNSLQILPATHVLSPSNSSTDLPVNPETEVYWTPVLGMYGQVKPGVSQIWLQNPFMDTEIVGTITFNPLDDRLLIFEIDPDTLPQNTLSPVTSVINPQTKGPGHGLPEAINGQRYLIVENVSETSDAWGTIDAKANDIIQYSSNTATWNVSFDSASTSTIQYVINLTSQIQYRYSDGVWVKAFEGWYDQGDYSIVI